MLFHRNVRGVAISLVRPRQNPAAGQGRALQHLSPRVQRLQVSTNFKCILWQCSLQKIYQKLYKYKFFFKSL